MANVAESRSQERAQIKVMIRTYKLMIMSGVLVLFGIGVLFTQAEILSDYVLDAIFTVMVLAVIGCSAAGIREQRKRANNLGSVR